MKLTPEQLFAPPDPTPAISAPSVAEPCPKCGKNLIDPEGLGWCPGCGYCKSLAEDGLLKGKKSPGRVVATSGAVSAVPIWFWASWIFLAAGLLFPLYMSTRLPAGDNLPRAAWSAGLIIAGLVVTFVAQFCALCMLAPEEPTMSFKDALVPFRLWPMAMKRMPRYKECLWVSLLAMSLVVGGIVFVGGFNHWFTYLPKSGGEREKSKPASGGGGGEAIVMPE